VFIKFIGGDSVLGGGNAPMSSLITIIALFRNPQAPALLVDDEVDEVIDILDPRPSHMLIYLKYYYHPPAQRIYVEILLGVRLQKIEN
jgi:hypothetical protein